jgi:uncharacterized protein with FMN-binding domain
MRDIITTVRQLIAALALAGAFGFYILHQRGEAAGAVVTPNTNTAGSTSATSGAQTAPVAAPSSSTSSYKDGTYTGTVEDAYYGSVQVQVIISGGKITDVQFLQYPNDRSTSRIINGAAMPQLTQEAIQAQTANVDGVSGATDTSQAFIASLGSALTQAH